MSQSLPEVVSRYFELDAVRDVEAIVALFTDDATVVDEGATRQGRSEIRAWQKGPASQYSFTTEIIASEQLGPDRRLVNGRLTGNFPGGAVDLKFDFVIDRNRIARLIIAP